MDETRNRNYGIGALAELTGVSRRTVRYYVQRGLIDPPVGLGRGAHYTAHHAAQIRSVRAAQRAGAALDELAALAPTAPPTPPAAPPLTHGADDAPRWVRRTVLQVTLRPGVSLEIDTRHCPLDDETLAAALRRCQQAFDALHETLPVSGDRTKRSTP